MYEANGLATSGAQSCSRHGAVRSKGLSKLRYQLQMAHTVVCTAVIRGLAHLMFYLLDYSSSADIAYAGDRCHR